MSARKLLVLILLIFVAVSLRAGNHAPPNSPALAQNLKEIDVTQSKVEIDAGVCGFHTKATVTSPDGQNVSFEVHSDCEKILAVGEQLNGKGAIDAYQEISPAKESVLMQTVRSTLKGCCAGCAVPAGLFKAMQVAAGLALPKDITIRLAKVE